MSDQRRGRDENRPSGRGRGGPGGQGRPNRDGQGRPSRDGQGRPNRDGQGRPNRDGQGGPAKGRPSRSGGRDFSKDGRPSRDGGQGAGGRGRPRRDDGDKRGGSFERRGRRPERDSEERTAEQKAFDGPEIPESITGRELDRSVMAQLSSLPEKLALRVARHLVAAGRLMESDPATAYQHTLAARSRAGRLAVVREAVGEAAYAAGEFSDALAELRAARRMNGSHAYVAVMADCERALGRPDKALTLLRGARRDGMDDDLLAELVIVEAGARRDRGEIDAALRVLENAPLMSKSREPWVARLRYVYADTLVEAGKRTEAMQWFHRAEAVDGEGLTDAGARAAELDRLED